MVGDQKAKVFSLKKVLLSIDFSKLEMRLNRFGVLELLWAREVVIAFEIIFFF